MIITLYSYIFTKLICAYIDKYCCDILAMNIIILKKGKYLSLEIKSK